MKEKKITLASGQTLAYFDEGQGEPIVWIHGLACYKEIWERNLSSFSKYYRCIAIDLPGHGASGASVNTYNPVAFSDVVLDFLDQVGVHRCVLVGHSMGGQVALITALRMPNRFSELVVVAPAGCETFSETEQMLIERCAVVGIVGASWLGQSFLNLRSHFSHLDSFEKQALDRLDRLHDHRSLPEIAYVMSECIKGMLRNSLVTLLPRVSVPTLVIFGKNDQLIPNKVCTSGQTTQQIAENIGRNIPSARLRMWDNAGHFVHYERSSEVNLEIYKFLNRKLFG
jgi:pimeloyl-ACP methyl ester carboxylesterase